MFHFHWKKTTGRVVAARIREISHHRRTAIPLHNYVVEFRAPNGETTKLEIEQHLETIAVDVGSHVPLLVSPDGTKAVFDAKDPQINVEAIASARTEADEARFRKELGHETVNEDARRDAIAAFGGDDDAKK